ncbi:hypothetical protein D3C78_1435160 [compost metagenome]
MAGMRDESHRHHYLGAFATGSPRPVYVGNCSRQVSWLTVFRPWAWHSLRLPASAFDSAGSGVAVNITVHSCGGSRGLNRVPFLASARAEEPRKRKATHAWEAGQCLSHYRCNDIVYSCIFRRHSLFKILFVSYLLQFSTP